MEFKTFCLMFPVGWLSSFKGIQLVEAEVMFSPDECGCLACASWVFSIFTIH